MTSTQTQRMMERRDGEVFKQRQKDGWIEKGRERGRDKDRQRGRET